MEETPVKKAIIVLIHAFIGWAICGAIMGVGMAVTTLSTTLILHAILGPFAFMILSGIYFSKFNYTEPLPTALIFISFVIFMDAFIVALLIQKNFAMFKDILGTWLPFALIFLVTYVTGRIIQNSRKQ